MLICLLWVSTSQAYTSEDCIECHTGSTGKAVLKIDMEQFEDSVHYGNAECNECHINIIDRSHRTTMGSGAVNCNECHEQENHHGLDSLEKRPKCYSCHTKHHIKTKDAVDSSVHPGQLKTTCKGCHPCECGKTDYLTWFTTLQVSSHKKQDFGRSYGKEDCMGCHQGMASHGLVEKINTRDCDKCHQSKKDKALLMGKIHPSADPGRQPGIFGAAILYQILLGILIFSGFTMLIRNVSKTKKRRD